MYQFPDDLRRAYEAQPIPMVYYQYLDGKVVPVLVTDGFCKQTGVPREKMISLLSGGQFASMHPDDAGRVAYVSMEFANHRGNYDVVFRSLREDGYHRIHAIGRWLTMPDGTELAALVYLDLTESEAEHEFLSENYQLMQKDHFFSDPITKLPNVNYLNQFAQERIHSLRTRGEKPVLIYIDMDSMQSYNNQYGFAEGDRLLQLVALILKEEFGDSLIVRGAEDHFVIITAIRDGQQLINTVERVNHRIIKEAYGNTTGFHAGICVYEASTNTPEAIDHAKRALKQLGADLNISYRVYSREEDDAYWNQRYIIEHFSKALENGWFKVYYQGIVSVNTWKGVALEALARWVDPNRGIISPGEFIPVLERYHLLHRIDLYMFEQVCLEFGERYRAELPLLPVSVNISRQDFDHVDMVAELNRIVEKTGLEQYGIGREHLIIEITEQDIAMATDRFYEQLRGIRESGFRLWLDDFGSGYSSLNVFSKFDVDLIKFDIELLRNLDRKHGVNREILKSMVAMCKRLGIHTLAEGIETEEQRLFLQNIGCELVQGFLIYKPQPLSSILYRLRDCGMEMRPMETDERIAQMIGNQSADTGAQSEEEQTSIPRRKTDEHSGD